MNKKLAIVGHPNRGKEIIELLEMMGGVNSKNLDGKCGVFYFFIDNETSIGCASNFNNNNFAYFTLEKFWEKYPFKIGDKAVYEDGNDIVVINEIKWDDTVGDIFYDVKRIDEADCFLCPPELLKSYKETNMKPNKCTQYVYAVNNDHCGLRGFRSNFNVSYCSAQNVDKLPNGFELQEDGYFSWVNKKPKYPKTYKECCERVNACPTVGISYDSDEDMLYNDEVDLTCLTLRKLFICRDAYWKIAGEEMGLGKPWKPNWTTFEGMPAIFRFRYNIVCDTIKNQHCLLVFPTEEMRDAFYENFKDLIEQCKELL